MSDNRFKPNYLADENDKPQQVTSDDSFFAVDSGPAVPAMPVPLHGSIVGESQTPASLNRQMSTVNPALSQNNAQFPESSLEAAGAYQHPLYQGNPSRSPKPLRHSEVPDFSWSYLVSYSFSSVFKNGAFSLPVTLLMSILATVVASLIIFFTSINGGGSLSFLRLLESGMLDKRGQFALAALAAPYPAFLLVAIWSHSIKIHSRFVLAPVKLVSEIKSRKKQLAVLPLYCLVTYFVVTSLNWLAVSLAFSLSDLLPPFLPSLVLAILAVILTPILLLPVAYAPAVLAIENRKASDSVSRAFSLATKEAGASIIAGLVTAFLTMAVTLAAVLFTFLLIGVVVNAYNDADSISRGVISFLFGLMTVVAVLTVAFTGSLTSAFFASSYYRQRFILEGYRLQLQHQRLEKERSSN